MTTDFEPTGPSPLDPAELDDLVDDRSTGSFDGPEFGTADDEPLGPIDWNLLTGDEAQAEWLDLNAWVHWLCGAYGLAPAVVPPYWHRHDELVWELSALHLHWLNSYDPEGSPSGPLGWHRDFADARNRLREWVSNCGTRIDRDRATRQTVWPGEAPAQPAPEVVIEDREADFTRFVTQDVTARHQTEGRVRTITLRS